ncbi:MAG: SDR family oxidoreductase, partial [Blastochloris sp.]|nr:SDR family oxidoreductase [Blastochloris sp.]
MASLPTADSPWGDAAALADSPVFIGGYPRSGTTLVEQILASHSAVLDVRDDEAVGAWMPQVAEAFGGIDILVNNASAISLTGTLDTEMKRYDLMHGINTRGTFLTSKC